jgi:ribosomal protein L9
VHLDEAIRSVGTHEVRVHLFADVDPVISIEVIGTES